MGCYSADCTDFCDAGNSYRANCGLHDTWILLSVLINHFVIDSKFTSFINSNFPTVTSCPILKISLAKSSTLVKKYGASTFSTNDKELK